MKLARRQFILGSASLLALPALAQEARPQIAYIAAGGEGDGTSWESAAPLRALDELVERVGPGGTVLLAADGTYDFDDTIVLRNGGSAGAPVTITGAGRNGQPRTAALRGTRKNWSKPSSQRGGVNASNFGGNTFIALENNASHLRIANLSLTNFGRILDMSGQRSKGIHVENVSFVNIRDGIYTDDGSAVTDVVLRRFSGVGFSKKAVRFHGRSSNWLIEACELDSRWQFGDNFAVGIEANDRAHGLRIVGGYTRNCYDTQGGNPEKYWNADGVATERGNYDIVIDNHHSSGHTDGGYDLKSEATTLRNCVAEDNKRNYRIWGGVRGEPISLVGCSSNAPRRRGGTGGAHHIWLSGTSGESRQAASLVYANGVLAGGEIEVAILADGGNVAVHLVDTDTSRLPRGAKLFETDKDTSRLIVGSIEDPGITSILAESPLVAIAGTPKTVELEADGEASWRLISSEGDIEGELDGAKLVVSGPSPDTEGDVTIQARDTRGQPHLATLLTQIVENPVAPGVVFALGIASDQGRPALVDKTGISSIVASSDPLIEENAFRFDGKASSFAVDNASNFVLDGPFAIETELSVDAVNHPQDLVGFWQDPSNQRSFILGLDEDGRLEFSWSLDGSYADTNTLVGPVLTPSQFYKITVDRDDAGIIRLYLDGAVVAQTTEAVGPFNSSGALLRVTGRQDDKGMSAGLLRSLTITKGHPSCLTSGLCQ